MAHLPTAPKVFKATSDPAWIRRTLIAVTLLFFVLLLFLPLAIVFSQALSKGLSVCVSTLQDSATLHAIKLTMVTAAIAVPLNTIFGLAAAWAIANFEFRGKRLLIHLIDLPLWISPVVGGLVYVLVFGAHGWLGSWLQENQIRIIFAYPGLVLATIFVTFPFVARGLITLMQAQGRAEEEAAMTLGANGWQIFTRISLPKIKWGLLYGVILCNSRAMGEFGAVSVVSGHIRNQTNTMPLQVEILYNEFAFASAFTVAALLSLLAVLTLLLKSLAEWKASSQLRQSNL